MNEKTYAEAIVEKYKDKKVEILFDSDWGQRLYSEFSVNNKPTVIGKIVDALGISLDIEVDIISLNKVHKKIITINSWAILSVSEYDEVSQVLAFTKQVLGKQ